MKLFLKKFRHKLYNLSPSYKLIKKLDNKINKLTEVQQEVKLLNKKINKLTEAQQSELFSGERQVGSKLDDIRIDHVKRYELATQYIRDGQKILDLTCGIGYGSYLLANYNKSANITAIDISKKAIDYANKYYKLNNNNFICTDCFDFNFKEKKYDLITSFETIEHIKEDKKLLDSFYKTLKNDGLLILSTPNQELMPFDKSKFHFHIKHYTPKELTLLLKISGFEIQESFSQTTKHSKDLTKGWNGIFNIVVCKKM